MNFSQETITAILTVAGSIFVAWISYRLGRQQIAQTHSAVIKGDGTTREVEFRDDLLALIERQEVKLKDQDAKIERMDQVVEGSKTLVDELKRANLHLTIENQRLRARIEDVEQQLARVKASIQ